MGMGMKIKLVALIFALLSGLLLEGCTATKTATPEKDQNKILSKKIYQSQDPKADKIFIEEDFEKRFVIAVPNSRILDKVSYDLNRDGRQELILAFFDNQLNTYSNLSIVSDNTVGVFDLAGKDLNYKFISKTPFLKIKPPDVLMVPLYNSKLKKIINFEIRLVEDKVTHNTKVQVTAN